jgi:predicted porin
MNKKNVIAMGIGAVLALPAAVQAQSNVTVYGKLYPHINKIRVYGASPLGTPVSSLTAAPTAANANRSLLVMESGNSRIGFRGTEDLGNGLKALFQLEGSFGVDSGALNTPNTIFDQDTFVGLSGGFGTVKLGLMDSVYKSLGDRMSFPAGLASGTFVSLSSILSKQGFGSNNASRFHERRANNVRYESPEFSGFQVLTNYALGEVPGSTSSGSLVAGGVKYEAGPFYVALAHEVHNDFFGGSLNMPTAARRSTAGKDSKDTATRLTVQYIITPATRIEGDFARIELDESGAAPAGDFRNYKHNTWSIAAEHKIGAFTLSATYGRASAGQCTLVDLACSTSGLDGRVINFGGTYSISKRTQLFAMATQMKNGHSATYSNLGRQGGGAVAPGADIRQTAFGVNHNF